MDRRKLLIGIGLVAFVGLIGAGLYVVFFRPAVPEPPPPPTPSELVPVNAPLILPRAVPSPIAAPITGEVTPPAVTPPVGALPEPTPIAQGGVTAVTPLTETPAAFSRVTDNGDLRYYDPTSQRFFRIGADGRPTPLSDRLFPSVQTATWAPRDDRVILEFPDGANILYDFRTNQQVTLPAHWGNFSFSPDGAQIVGKSIGLDRENRFLFESAPDGSGFRVIEPLGTNASRVDVAWSPNNQVVAFSRTGNDIGDGRQHVLLIGRNGENLPGLVVEGLDFRPQWSPSGSRILYSATSDANGYRPELWVVDGVGDRIGANRQRLRVETWADKCAFAGDETLYCAVPERLTEGAGLEPRIADGTPDTIERIDLRTGLRTTVGKPTGDLNVRSLSIAPDGSRLYFTDQVSNRLHTMKLR